MRGRQGPLEEDNVEQLQEYVTKEEAAQQVGIVFERVGMLHAAYARVLVDELGEEMGRRLILKAIKRYGQHVGALIREKAADKGLDNSRAEHYSGDLPAYGTHERLDKIEVDGEERLEACGCGLWRTWERLGEVELGRLYCNVDVAKYMGFNPRFKQVHTKAPFMGDDRCELVVRPTSEQERADFANSDADWSYLDRPD
jgi:hypothetical protein